MWLLLLNWKFVSYIRVRRKIKSDQDFIQHYRALTLLYALLTQSLLLDFVLRLKIKKKTAFRKQSRLPKHSDLF